MPQSTIATALEIAPKVISAASSTKQIHGALSTIARTARLIDGEWIPELATQIPGVQQSLNFFGKGIEIPTAVVSHFALSTYLKSEIKAQLKSAQHALTKNSLMQSAASYVASSLPTWMQEIAPIALPFVASFSEEAMDSLACKMLETLDPLINAPTAKVIGKGTGYLATESAKLYLGHKLQYLVIGYLAEQFECTEYPAIGTTIGYAKQADDYRVVMGLFAMMLAANLVPYLAERFSNTSEKDAVKAKLKDYVLAKSDIDQSSIKGQIYAMALDATVDKIIASKTVDINQIKIALASLNISESALNYCYK